MGTAAWGGSGSPTARAHRHSFSQECSASGTAELVQTCYTWFADLLTQGIPSWAPGPVIAALHCCNGVRVGRVRLTNLYPCTKASESLMCRIHTLKSEKEKSISPGRSHFICTFLLPPVSSLCFSVPVLCLLGMPVMPGQPFTNVSLFLNIMGLL